MQVVEEFYQLVAKKMSVADFEQWVYATPELENILREDDYLNLITLNYKSHWSFYELQKLLELYIDVCEMRRRELLEILCIISQGGKPDDVLAALIATFNLSCKGYSFFEGLAYYGLTVDNDFGWDPEGKWAKMTEPQKKRYLSRFYPEVQLMADHLIQGLKFGAILLHTKSPSGEIVFSDMRGVAERSTEVPAKSGSWWQFWK